MAVSTLLVIVSIFIAVFRFRRYSTEQNNVFTKWLENKWYIDELYDAIIVKPIRGFSNFLNQFVEKRIIDGAVNGVGRAVNYGSRQLRWLQSGQVGAYVLLMVIGMFLLFIIQLFL